MKRPVIIFLLCLVFAVISHESDAQANWELGIRGADSFSAEATIPIAAAPRFHPAVYFDRFGTAAYFDWMFALSGGPQGLKFYPGVGPELWFGGDFDFDIAGNFGVEYSFDFPLTIGFDWRPAFRTTDDFRFRTGNWGLSARFRFGEGVSFQRTN